MLDNNITNHEIIRIMKTTKSIFIASILALLIPLNSFAQKSVSVRIGNIIVADRNLGASVPKGGVALNYINDTTHIDHNNSLFKGDYYTWEEAKTACPIDWRLPTKDEMIVIKNKMKFSDKRAYLENSSGKRCYFSASGFSDDPSDVGYRYWSSTEHSSINILSLVMFKKRAYVLRSNKSLGFSVRCVKAVPYSEPTSIQSSSNANGYVTIGNIQVYDRNIGTKVPQGGVALNYTSDTTHADHNNSLFKGDYYNWYEAKTACPSGWRLPTKDELEVISVAMQFFNETAYLEDGKGNRCYFPLSGTSNDLSERGGCYWSSTEHSCSNVWRLYVYTSSSVLNNLWSNNFSVRCVKTVE